jgi:hypothetical protein
MKVSTENDNNFRYEKITILVEKMPLSLDLTKETLSGNYKFIKYEKRLRKEGKNMLGLPIKHNFCHFSASSDA